MFKCVEKLNHKMETGSVRCRSSEALHLIYHNGGNLWQPENKNTCFLLNYKLGFETQCDPDGDMVCIFFGSL